MSDFYSCGDYQSGEEKKVSNLSHHNQPENTQGGLKYDQGKPRMELLSVPFIEGVAQVLAFGAKKYGEHNWRQGIRQSRLLGAALRHTFAFLRGEDKDPESGILHLYHAGASLMFAAEMLINKPELDDRYKDGPNG